MTKHSFKTIAYGIISALIIAPLVPIMAYAAPTDSSPPVVSITSPSNGASVFGTVTITANATDLFSSCVINIYGKQYDVTPLQSPGAHPGGNVFQCGQNNDALYFGMHGTDVTRIIPYLLPTTYTGVTKVEFYIDGSLVSTDTSLAYSYDWNTLTVANGPHTIQAKAYDGVNVSNSSVINVTVNNSSTATPPTSTITNPPNASTVSGTIMVAADATGIPSVAKVEFYVDGVLKLTDIVSPYSFAWDTKTVSNGTHTLQAKAYDPASNIGNSSPVTVTVNNIIVVPVPVPTPTPTSTPTTTPTPTPTTTPVVVPTTTPTWHHEDSEERESEHESEHENEFEYRQTVSNQPTSNHNSERNRSSRHHDD